MSDADELTIDIFQSAISRHQEMPLDDDGHPPGTMDELFVDYGPHVNHLNTADWQIIFGGPGTGKTHLLRVYEERSLRGAVAQRPTEVVETLPIYLDAQSFASGRYRDDDELRAQACFREFVDAFGEQLEVTVAGLQLPSTIYARLLHRSRRDAAAKALAVVERIREELDNPTLVYPFEEELLENQDEEERIDRRSRSGQAELGIDPLGIDASLQGRAGSESGSTKKQRRSRSAAGSSEPRWRKVRELIAELCKSLQIRRIDILIDNWTALDTYGTSLVQPYFADLLKKSLKGDKGGHTISVKIAADGLSTRLWDREGGRGLKREDDIETLVNLNEPLLEDDALISFYEMLLYRRLLTCDTRLSYLTDPDTPASPLSPMFIRSLFGDRETFELLVRGSEGRMRQFLQCVKQIARETRCLLPSPWSRERVLKAVQDRAEHEIQDYSYQSPAVQMLLTRIKPSIIERDEAVFSISRDEGAQFQAQIGELLFKGLLDPDVPAVYRSQATTDLLAFRVSQDLMKEWHRARSFRHELQLMIDDLPSRPERRLTLEELRIYLGSQPPETHA